MKRIVKGTAVLTCLSLLMTGCGQKTKESDAHVDRTKVTSENIQEPLEMIKITLSNDSILVDGEEAGTKSTDAVYVANDIVYYEEGKDFTYGEGEKEDEHSVEEAGLHTVVHITEPGAYELTGELSAGQVAVDLGENAEDDPNAVVTLVLNNVDIQCSVAPAVIFYNVYECSEADEETAKKDVDTSAAGANVIIADGSENNISGSYVARIYKSVELNEEGTEVVDSKKLHKYDAAFYSKMTMNVNGGAKGDGILNIHAENEGLDSELHLTINGGNISIVSGNDGINTNEDYVSVTTVNGGTLKILVNGSTGEGDGIDSNGWLVINGGTVVAEACGFSADAGIDSDMGIHVNGGTLVAAGNMLDQIAESKQNYVVFSFAQTQNGGDTYTLKDAKGQVVAECTPENGFSYLIFSNANIVEGIYTLWMGDTQLAASASDMGGMMGGPGGMMPGGMPNGQVPEDMEWQEDMEMPEGGQMPGGKPNGQMPEGMEWPEDMEMPERGQMPGGMLNGQMPEGMEWPEDMEMPERGQMPNGMTWPQGSGEISEDLETELNIVTGGNYFTGVTAAK